MSATLSVINNFTMESQGVTYASQQGASTAGFDTAYDITVNGTCHSMIGSLATATVNTVFDDDNDFPADFQYLHYVSDQDSYIQFVGSATNVIFKVTAKVPITLTYDSLLAAADTTIITGGAEPSVTDIDSVVIGNYSGTTMNYKFSIIN